MNALSDYLERARAGDTDAAFHGLRDLGPGQLPRLASAYRAEAGPVVRSLLLRVIREHREPPIVGVLAEAVVDPHPDVWKEALDGLVSLATPEAARLLGDRLIALGPDDGRMAWIEESLEQIRDSAGRFE